MAHATSISSVPDAAPLNLPHGYTGPAVIPGTNRAIWWTGRVAIGLRYTGPLHRDAPTRDAERLQRGLLARGAPAGKPATAWPFKPRAQPA